MHSRSDNGYEGPRPGPGQLQYGNGNGKADDRARAIILAGGRGTRLAPFTSVLPKPLMPIGDRSILEVLLRQLATHDISDVTLSVGYLSHLIQAVLGDGSEHGVSLTYVREREELGTAAPLRLIDGLDDTFLTMNGDVLTTLDFRALVQHHRAQENVLTIATRQRTIKIDYGVLHLGSNGTSDQVRAYDEKPEMSSHVSMGIYALEPRALRYIPAEGPFDLPDLVGELLRQGERVGAYQYGGLWYDIGRREDYEQAAAAWLALENHAVIDDSAEDVEGALMELTDQ
jgi:NDP-sugar pyrophosphorylase family protein